MAGHRQTTSLFCCCKPPEASGPRSGQPPPVDVAPGSQWPPRGDVASGSGSGRRPPVDVASVSSFRSFQLRHLHLDLRLNFALKEISGWLVLDLVPVQLGVCSLVLDSHKSLLIHSVDYKVPGSDLEEPIPLVYRLDSFTDFGSSLHVGLPGGAVKPGQLMRITVRYTASNGPAIWWLDPDLTCGRTRPLVFTQGHPVWNRSFFPCFDTPAVKSPYTATVRVPDGVTVLMSASQRSFSKLDRVFEFCMEFPVPSYLVALVAGDLQHADLGPRSRVWAEPCVLACAAQQLGGSVERLLALAERLFGPYLWGRCDLVFLPPSFPVVAMENPCLTFVVASILDSAHFLLVDLVHEIAHAWFGNAVTNDTWEEMWLSEGLATYAQRRITAQAYGEAFTCLETVVRLDALHRQLRLHGNDNPVSRLQVTFDHGVNPGSLMNLFTYEKGFCFVSYLCDLSGDAQRFHLFLQDYVSRFRFRSVGAQDFLDLFLVTFPEHHGVDWQPWLSGCGPPPYQPDLSAGASLIGPVQELCDLWTAPGPPDPAQLTFDLSAWSTFQVALFLDRLLDASPLTPGAMAALCSGVVAPLGRLDAEVELRWLQVTLRNSFLAELPRLRAFLLKHTSRMYTVPLYRQLAAGAMRAVAVEIFSQTRHRLHPKLRRALQHILSPGGTAPPPAPPPAPPTSSCSAPTQPPPASVPHNVQA